MVLNALELSSRHGSGQNLNRKRSDILHSGRLGRFSSSAARYTSSIDIDPRLLDSVIKINSAHILMLSKQGIVDSDIAGKILSTLLRIPRNLRLKEVLEDVHMNVEDFVISKVGKNIGGMLNLGKSRNDQVATALRMTLRNELFILGHSLVDLEKVLLSLAFKYSNTAMPGYTHLQRGQPVTVGHHLLAHFDSLDRDFERLISCYSRVNISPMGGGALASTGLPIDRKYVAGLLGFESLMENSLDAVSSRDFAIETIYVCSQIMIDLSRFAEEVILWTSKEFSFAEISDRYASTSSMMPQKKNAIVPEIARARAAQITGDLTAALTLVKALPLSYNLDLQELTRNLWSSIDKTISSLRIFAEIASELKFNEQVLMKATRDDDFLYATEIAEYLVSKHGLSFREAHGRVGLLAKYISNDPHLLESSNQFRNLGPKKLSDILGVKIAGKEIESLLDPGKVLSSRKAIGSPNPTLVKRACKKNSGMLAIQEKALASLEEKIVLSQSLLSKAIENVIRNKQRR